MVDFKETAKEIFDICRYPSKADGRATEKIKDILEKVYYTDRDSTDFETRKSILTNLLYISEIPKVELNTVKMQFEMVDMEKIAEFLLDNGVEIVNPITKYILDNGVEIVNPITKYIDVSKNSVKYLLSNGIELELTGVSRSSLIKVVWDRLQSWFVKIVNKIYNKDK